MSACSSGPSRETFGNPQFGLIDAQLNLPSLVQLGCA
jgi:hypothetical protein